MAERARVVHIFGVMDVGGAELRTLDLQRQLRELEFCFITLSGRVGTLAPEIERHGGLVHPLKLSWAFPFHLFRFLRTYRPTVVESHVATFSGFICLIGAAARVPVRIAHFHSDGDGRESTWTRRIQRRVMVVLIDRFATLVVGVSPSALTNGYRGDWRPDSVHGVVPNGTDTALLWQGPAVPLREEVGAGSEELLILHVGRPAREKNRIRLPQILADVQRAGIAARLVLVGPRAAEDDAILMSEAVRLEVGDRVHFLGERADVGAIMRGSDVLLLTSTREGLPGVVAEAAAVGTPVVSSDVGGALWLAAQLPNITCLALSEPGHAWAAAVVDAVKHAPDRLAARSVVETSPFGLAVVAATHREIYRSGRLPCSQMRGETL